MRFYSRPLLCRVHHKWHSARHCQTRHRPIGKCHNHYQEEKIEIAWAHHKSQQSFPCNPKRFHLRKKKKRQTERKKLADIITEWMGSSFTETQHTAKTYGESWSKLVGPMAIPSHGTIDDESFFFFKKHLSFKNLSKSTIGLIKSFGIHFKINL